MRKFVYILIVILFNSCVYDPPLHGFNIIIENQSDNFVYVIDSLPESGKIILYDTFSVNKKIYISAKGNLIPKYSKWNLFITEQELKLKNTQNNKLTLYFISSENQNKNYKEIRKNELFRVFHLNIKDVKVNSINYIFYLNDTICLSHEFNMEKNKRKSGI